MFSVATPQFSGTTINLAARVGDAAPTGSVTMTNAGIDPATGKASANPDYITGQLGGSPKGSATSAAFTVSAKTTTAGTFTASQALTLTSGDSANTSSVFNLTPAYGNNPLSLTANIYTPAAATVTPSVDFGIVHVGDPTPQKAISVTNSAPVTALNDVLTGGAGTATPSPPFSISGNLGAGLPAGSTDKSSITAGLSTKNAGIFGGSATLSLTSHDSQLADAPVTTTPIALAGQVNNYAQSAFLKTGGDGTFTQTGSAYKLDFGTLIRGFSPPETTDLAVANPAAAPADDLSGTYSRTGNGFILTGFNPFAFLAAGGQLNGLLAQFDPTQLGLFDEIVTLHGVGSNASGYSAAIGDITLELVADVVPEPGTLGLMGTALAGLIGIASRRKRRRSGGACAG